MSTISVPLSVIRNLPASALGRLFAARILDLINDDTPEIIGDWLSHVDDEALEKLFMATPAKAAPKKPAAPRPAPPRAARSSVDTEAQSALLQQLGRMQSTGASAESLRVLLGVSPGQVKGMIKRAKDAGLVRAEGEKRNTRYFLTDKANVPAMNGAAHVEASAS